ncbi:MAG: hypothetical protein LBQ12_04765 [Deltaproteobacteria bacterium]|jgi:dissimilatory sulfite reductase (desulfoviridin) alpha/beta subunit|nr:hypothetical protein [Deltaproteobacteria bacterium]
MPSDIDDAPPPGGPGVPDGPDDTFELDLSEKELALASVSITPGGRKAKDSTHAMEEPGARAPAVGASIGTALRAIPPPLLEPVLAGAGEPADDDPAGILPPPCLARLGAKGGNVKVAKEGHLAWSLAPGGKWPVYVRRRAVSSPSGAVELLELARAARRWGSDRLCLSPQGDLDMFFNDRESFVQAGESLTGEAASAAGQREGAPERRGAGAAAASPKAAEAVPPATGAQTAAPKRRRMGGPALLSRCRGLFFCPNAAVDTIGASELLLAMLREDAPGAKAQLSVSVHGCQAGCGFDCGVYEYTDLRIIGKRSRAPVPDQELLALSPRLKRLAEDCPSGALAFSGNPEKALELDEGLCVKCGACAALDPSFRWPAPMGSYLTLELSGRRIAPPRAFLPPRTLVARADDAEGLFRKISGLVALFVKGGEKNEILSDFMDRTGLAGYFD